MYNKRQMIKVGKLYPAIIFLLLLFLFYVNYAFSIENPLKLSMGKKHKSDKEYASNEVLIKIKENINQSYLQSTEGKPELLHAEIKKLIKKSDIKIKNLKSLNTRSGIYKVEIDTEQESVESAIEKLKKNPHIEYAEPNYIRKLQILPNDYNNYNLWGLQKIHATEAWDIVRDSSSVVVALVDSGVDYTHEDLKDNIWINQWETFYDGIDNDSNGYVDDVYGICPACPWTDPMDDSGHGTHVAGIIGAIGDNSRGVVGVNWKTKILSCKACSEEDCLVSDIVECLKYIATMKDRGVNIKVVNASLGGDYFSQSEYDAINYLRSRGILLVTAAGNDGRNNDYAPQYPCYYDLDNIICVAATDQSDNLAYYSNYGSKVHLAAPGAGIISTYIFDFDSSIPQVLNAFYDDFENGTANWSLDPPWGITTKQYYSPSHSLTDSPDGNYANNIDISAITKSLNLTPYRGKKMYIYSKVKGTVLPVDRAGVLFSKDGGSSWTICDENDVDTEGQWWWILKYLPEDFKSNNFKLRFRLRTGSMNNADGIYIDDVTLYYIDYPTNIYEMKSGTSMATPFVTGAVALLYAKNPDMSYQEIKNRILSTVDKIPSLSGYVSSGGRLNLYRALTSCNSSLFDVTCSHWAYNYILNIYNRGITSGCGGGNYCPENPVTRAQMAAFIIRAIEGEPVEGSYSLVPYFDDVPSWHWAFKYVQRVRERNIAQGYGNFYAPDYNVTREQMAKMLIMAMISQGKITEPPADYCSTGSPFSDVDQGSWSCRFIKKLKELGLTTGYSDGTYRPQNNITRAEMAKFIYKAFLE